MDLYQQFIHKSRYARWNYEHERREVWGETVIRYLDFMQEHLRLNYSYKIPTELYDMLFNAVSNLDVMPSMRAMMTAGPALQKNNIAAFNCSYLPCDRIEFFPELLYILMHGTGVGYSVESSYTNQLPTVPKPLVENKGYIIFVQDSKEGWRDGLYQLVQSLYEGVIPVMDTSLVRPAGAILKTFGGRASGPAPLVNLFNYIITTFKEAEGRKLTTLECHDIGCNIADCVVVGGVRRSALISLSDLEDTKMRTAKTGQWYIDNGPRAFANNSAVYNETPDSFSFLKEWTSLVESQSGERGIFNREAAAKKVRSIGRRDSNHLWGTNPCSEIILRPNQFCNLSEVVVRSTDTVKTLQQKVKLATILGTFQSTLTDIKGLSSDWVKNTEEERLLGVSLTGIMDNTLLSGSKGLTQLGEALNILRHTAVNTNRTLSNQLGIQESTAITCVKPSGTVSQLVDAASGIHTRHSDYYIRTVRGDNKDPLTQFLKDSGIPNEPAIGKENDQTVFSFPIKAPDNSLTRYSLTALDHLKLWMVYASYWCEHKPSITVSVNKNEWVGVGAYVYENFDRMSGVSFLPTSEHTYQQAPYQECDQDKYLSVKQSMPEKIDWNNLRSYEIADHTVSGQTFACSGDVCEVVDLT